MGCYHPIPALQRGTEQPKLWPPIGTSNLAIPCGTCIGCLSERATQWAHRCGHEAKEWQHNTFLTLTYDDDHLPLNGYLQPYDLTNFLKRLRKAHSTTPDHILRDQAGNLRYFGCGEYGERTQRPHYHLLVFNCGFRAATRVGRELWEAEHLRRLWPYGNHSFGPATPAAANYIAQYTLKKQRNTTIGRGRYGSKYLDEEGYIDANGEWHPRLRPGYNRAPPQAFIRMSLKPAIGAKWLEKYGKDLQHGYLVVDGRKFGIPRTYRKRLELHNPGLAEDIAIKTAEHRKTLNTGDNNTEERRKAGEIIHKRLKELNERGSL